MTKNLADDNFRLLCKSYFTLNTILAVLAYITLINDLNMLNNIGRFCTIHFVNVQDMH